MQCRRATMNSTSCQGFVFQSRVYFVIAMFQCSAALRNAQGNLASCSNQPPAPDTTPRPQCRQNSSEAAVNLQSQSSASQKVATAATAAPSKGCHSSNSHTQHSSLCTQLRSICACRSVGSSRSDGSSFQQTVSFPHCSSQQANANENEHSTSQKRTNATPEAQQRQHSGDPALKEKHR